MKRDYNFSTKLVECITAANKLAVKNNNQSITIEHILVSMIDIQTGFGYALLKECSNSIRLMRKELYLTFASDSTRDLTYLNSPETEKVVLFDRDLQFTLSQSEKVAKSFFKNSLSKNSLSCTEHFVLAVLSGKSSASMILKKYGCDFEIAKRKIQDMIFRTGMAVNSSDQKFAKAGGKVKRQQSNKDEAAPEKSALELYTKDLTELARQGKLMPVIGRDTETARIIQILGRKTKNNPVLLGEAGVGKTACAERLAQIIVAPECPEWLKDKKLLQLDLPGMVAGTKYRGQFEDRMKEVIKEVEADDSIILVIDELHTINGAGAAEGAIDAANMIKDPLARGRMRLIGLTTLEEYRKHIEKDKALDRRFQTVIINPPSVNEAIEILRGLKEKFEEYHGVSYDDEALVEAVKLSDRYLLDKNLPDKAIDVIDEAGSRLKMALLEKPQIVAELEGQINEINAAIMCLSENEDMFEKCQELVDKRTAIESELLDEQIKWEEDVRGVQAKVTKKHILRVVESIASIPLEGVNTPEEKKRWQTIEETLGRRVVAQKDAIKRIAQVCKRNRVGLKEPNKPKGSFIFFGPTGVGKTEAAKAIAEFLFGDEKALVSLDMSEYMEKHTVSRLTGAPPGYVGHESSGVFEKVRKNPHVVVLLDEIEKAHPDIWKLLLQILEEGRITDSHKNVISFKHAYIIMTSNIGVKSAGQPEKMGFGMDDTVEDNYERLKRVTVREAKKIFSPELLNRVDEQIVFHNLSEADCEEIVDNHLGRYNKNVLLERNMELNLSDAVKAKILAEGFSEEYGAREIKRAFNKLVVDPLADYMLEIGINEGSSYIFQANIEDGKTIISHKEIKPTSVKRKNKSAYAKK